MNFLILILYNDTELYRLMLELLIKHYRKYNEKVKFYFIELQNFEIENTDILFYNDYNRLIFKGNDSLYPGCMDKTIKGLEFEIDNILKGKYDYIIRTNISSIININLLIDRLNLLPIKYDYMGSIEYLYKYSNIVTDNDLASKNYASGTMIIMSPKFAKLLIDNKQFFNNNIYYDDFVIGVFANKYALTHNIIMNFTEFKHIVNNKFDPNIILYRNRSNNMNNMNNRIIDVKNMFIIINEFIY